MWSQGELVIMQTNNRCVIIENIVWFTDHRISRREMYSIENYCSVMCHGHSMFVRSTVLSKGYMSIYWRRSHVKKTVSFSVSWGGGGTFRSVFRSVGLIRRIVRCVTVLEVKRRLIAAGYNSRQPDRCSRPTPDNRQRCHMLAHRH